MRRNRHTVLPGFRLTLGFTLFYLCLIVLVPLLTLPARTARIGWDAVWATISDPRVVASYKLSVGAALAAAAVNAVFGLVVAWVLARYR
ncbi:MAG: sulfate ABC transporter permease subunit CysT, partial [Acidobacteria bacterium]